MSKWKFTHIIISHTCVMIKVYLSHFMNILSWLHHDRPDVYKYEKFYFMVYITKFLKCLMWNLTLFIEGFYENIFIELVICHIHVYLPNECVGDTLTNQMVAIKIPNCIICVDCFWFILVKTICSLRIILWIMCKDKT